MELSKVDRISFGSSASNPRTLLSSPVHQDAGHLLCSFWFVHPGILVVQDCRRNEETLFGPTTIRRVSSAFPHEAKSSRFLAATKVPSVVGDDRTGLDLSCAL